WRQHGRSVAAMRSNLCHSKQNGLPNPPCREGLRSIKFRGQYFSRRFMPELPSLDALDAIDRRILAALQEDGRLSNVELARQVNLSPSPCLARVKALEKKGFISAYVA